MNSKRSRGISLELGSNSGSVCAIVVCFSINYGVDRLKDGLGGGGI